MKSCLFTFSVALFMVFPSLIAQAAPDLADGAFVRVSEVENLAGILSDQSSGAASVHDNDLDTYWHPPVGADAWIEFDLSTTRESLEIEIESVSIKWKDSTSRKVTVYVGPDRYALYPAATSEVFSTDALNVYLPKDHAGARYLKIEFQPGDFKVSEVEIKAADSGSAPAIPQNAKAKADGHRLRISWGRVASAHHYEISRNTAYELVENYHSTTLNFVLDRPRTLSRLAYRVRSVGYDGRTSGWAEVELAENELAAYNPASLDYPRIKGVVEGFYGQPWRHRTRLEILHRMSVWGMNTYLYCPKSDEKHRNTWRELYDDKELADFEELNEFASMRGIDFVYGISPGNDIDPLDDEDFSDLQSKLQSLFDVGIRHFALLMDDISAGKDGSTGENHAFLANRLFDWLRTLDGNATLIFVPTVYYGTSDSLNGDERDYLTALAAIDSAVPICWTGEGVFDRSISAAESADVEALIGRNPLIWDNYPVNDYSLAQTLHLASVEGRGKELLESVEGILVNPMVEGNASLFAIASYGALFDDPQSYDSQTAWSDATVGWGDDIAFAEWSDLVELFSTSEKLFPDREELPELNELIEEFILAVPLYDESEVLQASKLLLDRLFSYYSLAGKLEDRLLSNGLYEELYYRLQKLSVESEKNILAVNLMLSDVYNVRSDFSNYEDRLSEMPDVSEWRYNVADDTFSRLLGELQGKTRDARFSASGRFEAIVAQPMPNARLGQTYSCDIGFNMMSGCEWTLKADFDYAINSRGVLSFLPEKTGVKRVMAICRREGTIVSYPFEVEIGPALNVLDVATLEPSSELKEFGPVKALVQNGVIYPESGYSPMSRNSIRGPWKRMRAALDNRLSFAVRNEEIVARLELESCGAILPDFDDSDWDSVYMPQPENMLAAPYHPSGPEEYYGGVWYRVKTRLPSSAPGTRLVFSAASYIIDVWADGVYLGWHEGVYTPAYFELPDELLGEEEITLVVRVDHPPHGTYPGMLGPGPDVDFFDYAGIVQDVGWEYYPAGHKVSIKSVTVKPLSLSGKFQMDMIVEETTGKDFVGRVQLQAFKTDSDSEAYLESSSPSSIAREENPMGGDKKLDITLSPGQISGYRLEPIINQAKDWNPWKPVVYILRVSLYETDGEDDNDDEDDVLIDRYVTQIGFRLLEFDKFGRLLLNNRIPFFPSFTYYEDRPFVGMQADWEAYKQDFRWMKAYGAKMVRLAGYPQYHYAPSIADRIGMAVLMEIPVSDLNGEGLADLTRRGVALQSWREMIFANYNRPSVFFWSACESCSSSSSELADFITVLHNDLDNNYPDGRFVTEAADAQDYFEGVKDSFAAVDIIGISSFYGAKYAAGGQGISDSVNDLFYRISQDWSGKPVIVTGYGAPSGLLGDSYRNQNHVASGTWKGVAEYLQVDENRAILEAPGVIAMSWTSFGDGFSNADGVRTYGAFGLDRYTKKPVADLLRDYHAPYERNSYNTEDSDVIIPNQKDAQGCNQADVQFPAWLLLLLTVFIFRLRLHERT